MTTKLTTRVSHACTREMAKLAPPRKVCQVCFGSGFTFEGNAIRFCDCSGIYGTTLVRLVGNTDVLQPLDIYEDAGE
jgi:hypothetical protein